MRFRSSGVYRSPPQSIQLFLKPCQQSIKPKLWRLYLILWSGKAARHVLAGVCTARRPRLEGRRPMHAALVAWIEVCSRLTDEMIQGGRTGSR